MHTELTHLKQDSFCVCSLDLEPVGYFRDPAWHLLLYGQLARGDRCSSVVVIHIIFPDLKEVGDNAVHA